MGKVLNYKIVNMSFMCAILVVLIHVWQPIQVGSAAWWLYRLTGSGLSRIAVPVFFCISGYFLAVHIGENGWWRSALRKRVSSIFVPYLLWSVIWSIYTVICWFAAVKIFHLDLPYKLELLKCFAGLDLFRHPQMGPLWYLRALMFLVIISPLINYFLCCFGKTTLCILFLFSIGQRYVPGTWKYFLEYSVGLGFVFYFALGIAIQKSQIPNILHIVHSRVFKIFVLGLWCGVMLLFGGQAYDMMMNLLVPFLAVIVWDLAPTRPLFGRFCISSFAIYLVHWIVLDVFSKMTYPIPASVAEFTFRATVGIFVSWLLAVFLNEFTPGIFKRLFGGR